MNFIPSADYEGLLRQAKSLARLLDTKEQQIKLLNDHLHSVMRENLKVSYDNMELNSLREMNEILINRVEELEARE